MPKRGRTVSRKKRATKQKETCRMMESVEDADEMDVGPNRATLVGSIPLIVSAILENATAKQLNTCAQVCSEWRRIANSIKKRRYKISWYFFHYCQEESLGPSHCVPCCPKDRSSNCLEPFMKHLDNIPSEPSLTLIFCSKALVCFPEPHFAVPTNSKKRKLEEDEVDELQAHKLGFRPVIGTLMPYLPKNTEVGFCTARGITGTDSENSFTKEIEFCPAFCAVHFPPLPGVEIYRFPLSGMRCNEPMDIPKHTGIPEDTPVKCMLVFLYDRIGDFQCLPYNKLIGHYLKKQECKMALGGAYINHMYFPNHKPRRRNQCYGIAFTGENVEAASVVITKDMDTESKIVQQLSMMHDKSLLQGQCIAFMFTCVGRGTNYYNKSNVESSLFRAVFPNIPLFGVFGSGEIGKKCVPNMIGTPAIHLRPGSWMASYATVFVIISVRV